MAGSFSLDGVVAHYVDVDVWDDVGATFFVDKDAFICRIFIFED